MNDAPAAAPAPPTAPAPPRDRSPRAAAPPPPAAPPRPAPRPRLAPPRPAAPPARARAALRLARALACALPLAGCGGAAAVPPESPPGAAPGEAGDVGTLARASVEARHEDWRKAREEAAPDPQAARALATAPPGAEVTVFLGVWCPDSRREVPRLWKAFDLAGPALPFAVTYVGVDAQKRAPGGAPEAAGVRYVPTIVVRRGGREVGRVVESAPDGVIERALLDLLTGARSGVVSGRRDLAGG